MLSESGNGNFQMNFLLVKLDNTGNVQWQNTYGPMDQEGELPLLLVSKSGYLLERTICCGTGTTSIVLKLDLDGNILWQKKFLASTYAMTNTNDGRYVLAGDIYSTTAAFQAWIAKLDTFGNTVWQKSYIVPYPSSGAVTSIEQTRDRGYIVGAQNGTGKSLLLKLDWQGMPLWEQEFSTNGSAIRLPVVIETSDGGYAVLSSDSQFNANKVLKVDSKGRCCLTHATSTTTSPAHAEILSPHLDTIHSELKITGEKAQATIQKSHAIVTVICYPQAANGESSRIESGTEQKDAD